MAQRKYRKKYVKLYNKLWTLIHAEHKFVVTSNETHDELVARLVGVLNAAVEPDTVEIMTPKKAVELILSELLCLPR